VALVKTPSPWNYAPPQALPDLWRTQKQKEGPNEAAHCLTTLPVGFDEELKQPTSGGRAAFKRNLH